MFVEARVVGDPRIFGTELEHEAFDEAVGSEMDKVRGGEAVDGDDGEWMRRRWERATSHVDRQYTHEMLTRCAKADPRSEIRCCGSRGSFPRSVHTQIGRAHV